VLVRADLRQVREKVRALGRGQPRRQIAIEERVVEIGAARGARTADGESQRQEPHPPRPHRTSIAVTST